MARPLTLPRMTSLPQVWARARPLAAIVALPLLLFLALGLRLYGIDWDDGHLYHADERAILTHTDALNLPPISDPGVLLDADESPWNPRWFPYGTLPLYLLKGVQLATDPVLDMDVWELRLAGRAISALADVLTVLTVYLLALRLADRRVALLATALTTLAVLHIQLSHFYAVDTLLTLFVTLSLLFAVRVMQEGGRKSSILAGASVGLALATKFSAAPLLLPLFLAHALSGQGSLRERWPTQAKRLALALGTGLIVLFLAHPYAFLDAGRVLADLREQSEMVRGVRDYTFTRQYIGTLPYLHFIPQLTLFGLGLPVGLMAWAGLLFAIGRVVARRRRGELLLLAWVLPYLLITGSFQVKFLRYLLPITPLLLLFGAQMLVAALDWAKRHRQALVPWARASIALVVVFAAFYALAFTSIYSRPHTAVGASEWLTSQGLPDNTTILREHWDDSIPDLGRYQVEELPLYDPDGPWKTQTLVQGLSRGDYLVLYSSRLYGSIPRLTERYPDSARYYRLLLQGDLGYQLVHFEATYPSLLGVAFTNDTFSRPGMPVPDLLAQHRPAFLTFDLGYADDSFTVFDHPKVLIFENQGRLSEEQLQHLLSRTGTAAPPFDPMVMPAAEWAAQRAGGTWQEIVPADGLGDRLPLLMWLALVYAASLAVLPLGLTVFRFLPDRGYLLSRPLGLLLLAYVPWLLASLKWATFSRGSILLGLGLLVALSAWLWVRNKEDLWGFVKQRWRLLLTGEVLFLAAFLSFTLIRMANPDLWHPWHGGEKPLDFAYLNAVVRSTYMPPFDPWFAGGAINYYYFGHFMVATLIKATGVPPAIAFNLAVPLFFAMTVGAAFSIGYNLAEGARRALTTPRGASIPAWSPLVAAVASVLFLTVLGNLDGAIQLVGGAWERLAGDGAFPAFDYWRSRSMMPPDPPGFEITEFPLFAFLFADLHAHLMALPLTLLALGLAVNTLLAGRAGANQAAFLASLVLLSLTVGALWATNAWDFPIYLGIAVILLVAGEYLRRRRLDLALLGRGLGITLLLVALAVLLWLPYHLRLNNVFDGFVGSPVQTNLGQYLAIHSLFMFLVLSFLGVGIWQHGRAFLRRLLSEDGNPIPSPMLWGLTALGLVVLTFLLALALLGYVTVAFLLVLVLLVLFLVWRWLHPAAIQGNAAEASFVLVPLLLLGLAFVMAAAVDLVVVRKGLARMDTLFKVYFQAWVFLALAGAYILWHLGFVTGFFRGIGLHKGLWLAGLALLLLSTSVFPVLGTRARLSERFEVIPLTLDGTAYMEHAVYTDERGAVELRWDRDAINWLQENVVGSPVIVEGLTPLYHWGSRISVYTGLPTVVGWDFHEIHRKCGQNPCQAVHTRLQDVDTIYATESPDEALRLLHGYGVTYLYLGETEQRYYPPEGLAKFAAMAQSGQLQVVYRNQAVSIFHVGQPGAEQLALIDPSLRSP